MLKITSRQMGGITIYQWRCEICDKVISGTNIKQVEFNRDLHHDSCKKKFMRKVNKEEKQK